MEEDLIIEIWDVFKEYISDKNKETAANHFVDFLTGKDVDISVLKGLVGYDSHLDEAIELVVGEEEEEEEFEEWLDEDIEDEREEEERVTLSVEDNKILTLYDLWIHSFYIHRNMYLFMVFLDIIIEELKKMNDEDYQKVLTLDTNTINLRYLNNITDDTNGHFIYYINKSIEENSIYKDKFLYYIFEPYRFLITKKKNYSYYTLDTLIMKFYIKKFFDEVFFVRDIGDYLNFKKDGDRIMQNLYQIIRDIHLYESMICDCRYYHYWIDKFKREEEVGKIRLERNFFIIIFLR